jgi:putative serine protease PepD
MAATSGPGAGPWRLAVRTEDTVRSFDHWPGGRVVSIGRDQACDIVLDHPSVSRHHADLVPVPNGWRLHDHSSGGSWVGGSRATSMLVDRPVELHLGDPLTGALLDLDVLVPDAVQHRRQRRKRSVRLAKIVTPLALLAVLGSVLGFVLTRHDKAAATGISPATLLAVEQSSVKLDMVNSDGEVPGWGSGTIISPDGLILTNSHVADPNAAGMATQYGGPLGDATPAYLLVEMRGSGGEGVVHPMYRAKKVIVDGYLDLAVLRIYADAQGHPVNPATLHLPFRPIADPDSLKVGDDVTVVGFPGVSESKSATVTKGDASAFVYDARLHSNRAWIETSARIAHGNSGGSAVNDQGQLIGVPTRIAPEHEGDIGWWFRPVSWAIPLIAKARSGAGASYVTPYIKAAGAVKLTPVGWSTSSASACSATSGSETLNLKTGYKELYFGLRATGLQPGVPIYAKIIGSTDTYLLHRTADSSTTCWPIPVRFIDGDGYYEVMLFVDPAGNSTQKVYLGNGTGS